MEYLENTTLLRSGAALEQGQADRGKATAAPKHVWSIRTKLQIEGRVRDLAMFSLAIDSKLRGCDVVAIRLRMLPLADTRRIGQRYDKRRPDNPSDLN